MAPSGVPIRRARVTVRDQEGTVHTVEVTAATLFEAAAQALAAFREEGWLEHLPSSTVFEVLVLPPPVQHIVKLSAVERWLASSAKSPREKLVKESAQRGGNTH